MDVLSSAVLKLKGVYCYAMLGHYGTVSWQCWRMQLQAVRLPLAADWVGGWRVFEPSCPLCCA